MIADRRILPKTTIEMNEPMRIDNQKAGNPGRINEEGL